MSKKDKSLRIIIGIVITTILSSIALTNESIDYAAKVGFQNVNPFIVFFITTILAVFALTWTIWEVLDR